VAQEWDYRIRETLIEPGACQGAAVAGTRTVDKEGLRCSKKKKRAGRPLLKRNRKRTRKRGYRVERKRGTESRKASMAASLACWTLTISVELKTEEPHLRVAERLAVPVKKVWGEGADSL